MVARMDSAPSNTWRSAVSQRINRRFSSPNDAHHAFDESENNSIRLTGSFDKARRRASNPFRIRRRRHHNRHTIDVTATNIVPIKQHKQHKQPRNPLKKAFRRFSSPNEKVNNELNGSSGSVDGNFLPNSGNTTHRRRRRRQQRHTMDATATDIVKADSLHPGSPKQSSDTGVSNPGQRKKVLTRFLANHRRKSQCSGGSGSTVSRLTDDGDDLNNNNAGESADAVSRSRRTTMDMNSIRIGGSKANNDKQRIAPARTKSSGSSGGPRRATMDLLVTSMTSVTHALSSPGFRSQPSDVMDPKDYISEQARLQRQADDLHKGGQLKQAIGTWEEALGLAEKHQDTLTKKTELLCILMDLHLQVAEQTKQAHRYEYEEARNLAADVEDAERGATFHEQAAKRCVHRIKPSLVKSSWLGAPTKRLVEFLVQADSWELALLVADQIPQNNHSLRSGDVMDAHYLANMHFQVASQKLDQHRQGEALQHLQATVKHLQQSPLEERDMTMYLQVLQLLASEYLNQNQHELALEAYQEHLKHAPIEKQASLYCQIANVYIDTQRLNLALEKLQLATDIKLTNENSDEHSALRLQLLQTKGDVYSRLGRMEESLEVYKNALEEAKNPAEKAKILYTMGRLCIRLKRTKSAIRYFTCEMEITQQALGQNHLAVSRVLHELAKLYDEGLGEPKMALMKLNKALQIEIAVLADCHFAITNCQKCNPATHRMCIMHANLQNDISLQIRETKKAQGRIHFKLGDFQRALKASFQEAGKK